MEREVGGGIGMGNTCKPMAVSFQCMTKSTTKKKKKKEKKEKSQRKVSCNTRKLYKIQISPSINKVLLEHSHNHLFT